MSSKNAYWMYVYTLFCVPVLHAGKSDTDMRSNVANWKIGYEHIQKLNITNQVLIVQKQILSMSKYW